MLEKQQKWEGETLVVHALSGWQAEVWSDLSEVTQLGRADTQTSLGSGPLLSSKRSRG